MNLLKNKLGLFPRILIAIVCGIGAGMLAPEWVARLFETFNSIFSQFLGFMIPLIIVGFVAPAIADIGVKAGKMLLATVALAYGATLLSGMISYFISDGLFPIMLEGVAVEGAADMSGSVTPYFTVSIPPVTGVMTALVLAFTIGLATAFMKSVALKPLLSELREAVGRVITSVVIPLLPVYIFGIFMNMTVVGQVAVVLGTFFKVIVVIFGIHVLVLMLQYCVAGAVSGRNPFKMLAAMMPAYFTALGTQSSAATIPVTLRCTERISVSRDVAGFVVPLCATIHMSGSTLKIVSCALALMILQGESYSMGMFLQFIAMLGVTMVAAPGIPGGAIMAALAPLGSVLGFTDQQCAMMIALYIAMDSFGTACNVTGDGALAVIINRFFKDKDECKDRALVGRKA